MKRQRVHMPKISYIAAFVIGVILFASFWKTFFGAASSAIVLAGMVGALVAVAIFWIRNEIKKPKNKDN